MHTFRWIIVFLIFLPNYCFSEQLQGLTVEISDGDTFKLVTDEHRQIKIRLSEIDCPESGQSYGRKAKQALSNLIYRKNVSVSVVDIDRYGRTVGQVFVGDLNVNAEMVAQGAAWVYLKYAKDPALFKLEAQARAAQLGLWALPKELQIPPWEWRHNPKNTKPIPLISADSKNFVCAEKKVCREMTNCDEALFYLNTCGVTSLDGNHDGIPCSKLCK